MRIVLVLSLLGLLRQEDADRTISEIQVGASVDEAWAVWTTKEGLESCIVAQAEIDLRIGGLMKTHYDRKGKIGDPKTIENTILSYDPKRMLSIKATKPPEGFPFPEAIKGMWTVIYFEPLGPELTGVKVVSLGFTKDEDSQKMRSFFKMGNDATLKSMAKRFARK
jgi:uncharacterized protein YndB with AHSA1/START domain